MNITEENFNRIMSKYPNLSRSGFLYKENERMPFTLEQINVEYNDQFNAVIRFMATYCSIRKTTNHNTSSLSLKKLVEMWYNDKFDTSIYISNGMVILVALFLDYKIGAKDSAICWFKMNIYAQCYPIWNFN